jgi:hypothetical protein
MKLWDFLQEANIDNRQGLGNVPDNQNVDYLGLRVQMKPSVFLRLAATLYREQAASTDYIKQHVQKGGAIASPWLVIDIPQAWEQGDFQQAARVSGHEGRNRMWAVLETDGDEPIECHLFFSHGLRNRHILPSWIVQINERMIPERSNKAISGPFFTVHSSATTMQETTRTTPQGGRGTLKAKITRRYGGKVTCDKVKKLKSRGNATAHDKSQANWFQNMQDCNESQDLQSLTELVSMPTAPIEWKQQVYPNARRYVTTFEFGELKVDIRITTDRSRYDLQNAMLVDTSEINPQAMGYTILFMVNSEIIKTGLLGQKSSTLLAQTFGRILQWLKTHKWDYIVFTGERGSRNKLYGMISRQLAREFGAKLHFDFDTSDFVVYKPSTFAQKLVREALTWQLPSNNWAVQSQYDRDITYKFAVDGEKYFMEIVNIPEPNNRGIYDIEFFHEEHGMDITGLGVSHAMKVFSAVKQLARDAQGRLTDLPINAWFFSGRGPSRQKLYLRLAQQLAQEMDWKLTTTQALMPLQGDSHMQGYLIYNPKIENRILNPKLSNIQEAETSGSALTIFDIDDTLMKTSAAVYVVNTQGKRTKLTAQDFNSYQLKPGEYFDFQEFEDSDLFHDTSEPIAQIWRTAQNTLANTGRRPGSRVVIITARGPFNNTEKFLKTFEKHGLDMTKVRVFTVGGARNKKPLIRQLLQQHNYTETRIFDDHLGNLRDFLSLHPEFPQVTFKAFAVGAAGNVGEPVVIQGTTDE